MKTNMTGFRCFFLNVVSLCVPGTKIASALEGLKMIMDYEHKNV